MVEKNDQAQFYAEMGFSLKRVRQGKRISQSELAQSLGLVTQTVQKYESGEIKIPSYVLYACSKTLNVPIQYFYMEATKNIEVRESLSR